MEFNMQFNSMYDAHGSLSREPISSPGVALG